MYFIFNNQHFFRFLQPAKTTAAAAKLTEVVTLPEFSLGPVPQDVSEAQMRAKLLQKHKELLELQQKKIELELMQTKTALESKRFEEMESAIKQEKMVCFFFSFNQFNFIFTLILVLKK